MTSEDWKKITDHVINVENKNKQRHHITEEVLEPMIISLGDNDSADAKESLRVEFFDSDFEYDD